MKKQKFWQIRQDFSSSSKWEMNKKNWILFGILIIGLFEIASISALQAAVANYNLSGSTVTNTAYWASPASPQSPPWSALGTVADATQYTNMSTDDTLYAQAAGDATSDDPYWRFNFTINETIGRILYVNVTFIGHENASEAGRVLVWNYSSSAYINIGVMPTSAGGVITRNFTGGSTNATHIIQSSNKYLILYVDGTSFDDAGDRVWVDFVRVLVGYLKDVDTPNWSSNSTNSTLAGSTVSHNVLWTDDTTFSGYIFSFNNGNGTFYNDTWTAMPATNWTNVSKVANSTVGSIINWTVYANDSANNWNVTSNFNYTTTGVSDSCTCTPGSSWTIINGDQCTLSTTCNLGTGTLRIMNGALRITGTGVLNANHCFVNTGESLYVINGGKLTCR